MKILAIIITSLLILSPSLYAKKGHHKKMNKEIFKQLNLTKEQRKELKTMRKNNKGKMKALREEKKKIRKEMMQALKANTPDNKLRNLHNEIGRIHNKIKDERFEKMLSIRKVLNTEQREKFYNLKQKLRKNKKRNL